MAAEAERAEAVARDPRDREAWPAVTARAVDLARRAGRARACRCVAPGGILVAWKRGRCEEELDAAGRGARALRAGRLEVCAPGVPGLEGHRLVVVERAGPIDAALPARPRRAPPAAAVSAAPWRVGRAAALRSPGARRRAVGHPREPRRRSTRCSPRSRPVDEVWQLGDVVGYGPEPDEVVARLRDDRRRRRPRQPRRGRDRRPGHRCLQRGRPPGDGVDPQPRSRTTTRAWLAALPERLEREDFTLVHGSPRDPIWEYVTSTPVARAGIAAMDTPLGLHGHTHVPIAFVEDDGRLET